MQAEANIARIATNQTGLIRIRTECYTCYHWLPQLIRHLKKSHFNIDSVAEATRHPIQALLNSKLDLAIVSRAIEEPKLHC